MVVGKSSNFTEGFKSFDSENELMIANLKQAVNYSNEKIAIPDPKINIRNDNSTNMSTTTTPKKTIPFTLSKNISNSSMNNNIPMGTMPTGSMSMGTMPTGTMPMGSMSMGTMPTGSMSMGTMPTGTMPTGSMSMGTMSMDNMPTGTMPMRTMSMDNMSTGTMPMRTVSNNETAPTFKIFSNSNNNSVSKFKNIPKILNKDEEEEDDVEDEQETLGKDSDDDEEDDDKNPMRNKTRRQQRRIEEGFNGSMEIQSRYMRNILLALLLSCIGYLFVYSMSNNFLPLDEISPQLKKFKKLIYGSLFFLITYICLEVF